MTHDDTLMSAWEQGSPMRNFIYYLQRAICGALAFLVFHQIVLGLRLLQVSSHVLTPFEKILFVLATPGRLVMRHFLDPVRPLHLPPPLAVFFLNILFYFASVWLVCFLINLRQKNSFVGPTKRDPFAVVPRETTKETLGR